METLVINIPDKKSALVKELLKELGVSFSSSTKINEKKKSNIPNRVTALTIKNAHNGINLGQPVINITDFINGL